VSEQRKHVFLSYCSVERGFALKLAADLKNAGVNLWVDRLDIRPGDDWRRALTNAVDECAALICILSPEYVASVYCQRELGRADRMGKRIIPILLRDLQDKDWPLELERQQFLDFRNWTEPNVYAERLEELIRYLRTDFSAQFSAVPDAETRYLTSLIAELEANKSVMELVELTHQADRLLSDELERPEPRYPGVWTMRGSYTASDDLNSGLPTRVAMDWNVPLNGIGEALERYSRFVLIGAPGTGKTTTVQHLVLTAAHARLRNRAAAPLPIYLKLTTWQDDQSPEAFIRTHWPLESNPIELLARGEASLYLDGLNEMGASGAAKAARLRAWLTSDNAPQRVIVTCRSAEYNDDLILPLPTVQAAEMDKSRIEQFVTHYLGNDAGYLLAKILPHDTPSGENSRHLFQLARNPFLLSLLVIVFTRSPDGELPKNRGTLLQQLAAELWHQEAMRRSQKAPAFEALEAALSNLAFAMIDQSMPVYVPRDFALPFFAEPSLLDTAISARFLEEEGGTVRFAHQLMQEYFAALGLARAGLPTRLEQPRFNDLGSRIPGKWDSVIVALCGIWPEPDSIVRAVAEVDPLLALQCLASGIDVSSATREQAISLGLSAIQPHNNAGLIDVARLLIDLEDENAIALLIEAMRTGPWQTRCMAHETLFEASTIEIEGLEPALLDRDPAILDATAAAIRTIGWAAIPQLQRLLRHENWMVRRGAAWALGELGDPAAVPGLVAALDDPDPLVIAKALTALGLIGDAAALQAIAPALRHANWRVGRAAAEALGRIGTEALPILLEAAADSDQEIRWRAVCGLKFISDPSAQSALLEATRDASVEVRGAAVEALRDTEDEKAVNRLIELLKDTSAVRWAKERICDLSAKILAAKGTRKARAALAKWNRQQAEVALATAGSSGPASNAGKHSANKGKNRLLSMKQPEETNRGSGTEFDDLDSPDWMRRRKAVRRLADEPLDIALPKLVNKLEDEDCQVRLAAVEVLRNIDNEIAVEALIKALGDGEALVSDAAAAALVKHGRKVVPGLLKALESTNVGMRGAAVEALGKIADKSAVQPLIGLLEDTEHPWLAEQRICDLAARALLSIGTPEARNAVKRWRETPTGQSFNNKAPVPKAQEAPEPPEDVPTPKIDDDPLLTLLDALHEGEWGEREEAGKKLRQYAASLKGKADAARDIQRLIGATQDSDWVVRWAACEALAWAGDRSGVPHLIERLEDDNWMVRIAAVRGLVELQEASAVPAIANLVADDNHNVREATAEALGLLGEASGMDALAQLAQDEERFVRFAATEAVGRLGGEGALPILISALQDRDENVRWIACDALIKHGNASAVGELVKLLDDIGGPKWEEKRICDVAADALEAIGTPEAQAAVEKWRRSQPQYQ